MARGKRSAKRPAEQAFNQVLGRRIEVIRRGRKMTREGLASKLGVTDTQVYWWETGQNRIPPYFLELICRELDVNLGELVQNTRTPNFPAKTGMRTRENLLVSYAKSISYRTS
jgi:transcriptional regulator with XRE-family HTH domain